MLNFEPICVDTRTACQMLGIKRTLLFRYLAEGSLRRCKIGRKTVVPIESLKSFAAARIA